MKLKAGLLIIMALMSVAAFAQKKDDQVLFTVAKRPVTVDEFTYLYKKNNQGKKEEFSQQKIDEYLNLFVNFKLKVEEARKRGLDTTVAFKKEYNSYKEELRKPYLPDAKLIDSLTLMTYTRMQEEIKSAHILVNIPADASPADTLRAYQKILELKKRALNGEDFEALALQYSEDPSAKSNKGMLGWYTAMQMVFPYEQMMYATQPGQINGPVRTRFGYHIVKVYERRPSAGEVEVSHIMLRANGEEEIEKAKERAFEIIEKYQKGVSWNELCKEYSEDPSSKDTGGKLRPFGVGVMTAVPQFEEAAFNLKKPGDISDPVPSQWGWHIIRLENKIPLPKYEDILTSLKSRVSRDERSQISRQAVQQKMKREFGFSENAAVKETVLSSADSTLNKAQWKIKTEINDVLFSVKGKSYPAKDFQKFVMKNQKTNVQLPKKYIEQLYQQFTDEALGNAFEEKIKKNNPDYGFLLNEYYEGILLFEIMEKEVWNRASEDSVGQKKYYVQNQKSYSAGERINADVYSTGSKTLLEQLQSLLSKGDSVQIKEFVAKEKIRKDRGIFEKGDRIIFSKVDWKPGLYTAENNNVNYLVNVKSMVGPGVKSFEDARPSVISDYQNHLEKEWLAQLRKKYTLKINKKSKEKMIDQLVKSAS